MGAGGSVNNSELLQIEASKPHDGSDMTTLASAQAEIGRLRELAQKSYTSLNTVGVVIWGAQNLRSGDVLGKSDPS
jgi:hypothetical protein